MTKKTSPKVRSFEAFCLLLSPAQVSQLETHRKEQLAEHERFEFDTWGLRILLEELAQDEAESTYCWNSEDWEYDEHAPGWDGEAWEYDHE